MQDCARCKNHSICRLEHRNLVERCAFVNPTEEIPIIHGKAELELHDKQIRNKAIDEFAEKITLGISESFIWDMLATANENSSLSDTSDKIVEYVIDEVKKIAEQMKGGAE